MKTKKELSQEKLDKLIDMRNNGSTYSEIMKTLGVCKNTIIKYLKQNGVKPRVRETREITDELLRDIQNRYNEVHNVKIVSKEFGISYERLKRSGLILSNTTSIPTISNSTKSSRKLKQKAVEYKGGKCEICGYNKCISALEFHHTDPSKKDFTISGGTKSFDRVKPELDKCILVCSNCHREIHEQEYLDKREEARKLQEERLKLLYKSIKDSPEILYNKKSTKICPVCGKKLSNITTGKKYCSKECRYKDIGIDINNIPTKEELESKYKELGSWKKVHEFYNLPKSMVQRIRGIK